MIKGNRIVAIIPARGGSKGIPRKNILPIGGSPLIEYSIREARRSQYIDRIIVSTDDVEIAEISVGLGADVPFLRPREHATEISLSEDVILHAIDWLEAHNDFFQTFILLQPTSPLRNSNHIDSSLIKFFDTPRADSLISVTEVKQYPQWMKIQNDDGTLSNFLESNKNNTRRQDLQKILFPNGAIYISHMNFFKKNKSFNVGITIPFCMSAEESIDIDNSLDVKLLELALSEKIARKNNRVKFHKPINLNKLGRNANWQREIAIDQKNLANQLIHSRNELLSCPICSSENTAKLVCIYEYEYWECSFCGHVYSKNPPDSDKVRALYTGQGYKEKKSVQGKVYISEENFKFRVEKIAQPKVDFVLSTTNITDGKWVDIGAGVGDLVLAAKSMGFEAVGIESDSDECDFASRMGAKLINDFLNKDNAKIYLNDAKIVTLINVLEHVAEIKQFLELISRNINSNSFLVIEVPRHPSISSYSNISFPELAYRHIYSPDHLHIFTDTSISLLLKKFKFEIASKWFFGQDIFDLFTTLNAFNNDKAPHLLNEILEISNDLQKIVDENYLSDTMLIVAKKMN